MAQKEVGKLRDSLIFGAVIGVIGLLLALLAIATDSLDATKDAALISKISGAGTPRQVQALPEAPKLGARRIFSYRGQRGLEYASLIALSSPEYSGLVFASFLPDGSILSLKTAGSAHGGPDLDKDFLDRLRKGGISSDSVGLEAGTRAQTSSDLSLALSAISRAITESQGRGN